MTTSALRVLSIVALAAVSFSCADSLISGVPRGGLAALNLAPSFAQGASGGPDIDVARLTGVLRRGTDSLFAEATILGDSAILEFQRVPVTGDSTRYLLGIQAFDSSNVLVFDAEQSIRVLPGNNPPVQAVLEYSAPDATVETIDIPDAAVALDWAGAAPNDNSCLNRAANAQAVTQKQLSVTGKTAGGQDVSGVRVGWTSRDTTVVTVNDNGLVRSRCSNKSTWVVARTFLDKSDSVRVTVTAPAFSLRMSPESTSVARGATVQLTAVTVDENGNEASASQVSWHTSDAARATVSATGLVSGVSNGRALITARSGDRTTIGVVQVVRPAAAKVAILPRSETVRPGQYSTLFARAYDAQNRVIGDAREFDWFSKDPAIATVQGGTAKGIALGNTYIVAKIDGVKDSVPFAVSNDVPTGAVEGIIRDGSTEQGIVGASVQGRDTTVQTGLDGKFLLPRLSNGDDVTVTAQGYVPVTVYDVPVYTNDTLRIPPAPLAPTSSQQGTMTGKVVNALNGGGVAGATVRAYVGVNAAPSPRRPDVQPAYSTTTASDGSFSIAAAPGAYTFMATGTGYSQATSVGIAIGGSTRHAGEIILPPAATGGGMYVVVTWGTCGNPGVPCDLDAHLTGPQVGSDTTARFHTYHAARAYVAGDTVSALDVNDVTGPGPEVISLRPSAQPGVYRFYVHDATNAANSASLALSQTSGVRVDIYMDSRVVATFFPPGGQAGTLWKVFEWDGARLTQAGTIAYQADVTTLP